MIASHLEGTSDQLEDGDHVVFLIQELELLLFWRPGYFVGNNESQISVSSRVNGELL